MFNEDVCLGNSSRVEKIRTLSDTLNAKVVEGINGSQELLMLTSFSRESNEYQFKKCLQDRISEVASWHWVLEDLSKRLEEAIALLKHEHNALRVVIQRIQDELNYHSREASRPGAICPLMDIVEEAIKQEFVFLRDQKKNFERLILELDKQTTTTEKMKKKIENDLLNKSQSLSIDEMCAKKDYNNAVIEALKKKRKKGFSVNRWVKGCTALKRAGLRALCNAVISREQVRGARVQLSIAAQAYSARIDAVLRRRLHSNKIKIQDLKWQREEAIRDYASLEEELTSTEKSLIITMDQERIVEARLGDRARRPNRELTKDNVNRKLKDEQTQLRKVIKELRNNIGKIISLQNDLTDAIAHIDCCAEDLAQIINLDEDRLFLRQGEQSQNDSTTAMSATIVTPSKDHSSVQETVRQLTVIQEEDEDYPFDF